MTGKLAMYQNTRRQRRRGQVVVPDPTRASWCVLSALYAGRVRFVAAGAPEPKLQIAGGGEGVFFGARAFDDGDEFADHLLHHVPKMFRRWTFCVQERMS